MFAAALTPPGDEVEPLDTDGRAPPPPPSATADVEAVAVMLLFSFINQAHERRVGEHPGGGAAGRRAVAARREVVPEFREYVRGLDDRPQRVAAAADGRLPAAPRPSEVAGAGVSVPLHLMQTNGGVAPAARARELPIALSASGPAAGVIGGARLAELVGESDALTFDMGGTTADIGAGDRRRAAACASPARPPGMPINLPQIDVLCIGAGGGSIARVDQFGSLTVGPASAGADPGPAAYGLGGEEATVTDAHVVLGNVRPRARLGRRRAARPRARAGRRDVVGGQSRSAWRPRRPPRRSSASPTPTWPTRCA